MDLRKRRKTGYVAGHFVPDRGKTGVCDTAARRKTGISFRPLCPRKQVCESGAVASLLCGGNTRMNAAADTLPAERVRKRILPKSTQFVYFYEGFLMAVDS